MRKLLLLLVFTFFVASCSRDPKVQARRYVDNGNKFYAKSKFKEASIMYRRALQKDLLFGDAYYRLASNRYQTGRLWRRRARVAPSGGVGAG